MIRTNTICQPEELSMLQRVYKSILRESWFDRTEQNERAFARAVIDFFQRGIRDEELLFVESLSVARACFSRAAHVGDFDHSLAKATMPRDLGG